jgi:hypothetical protein
MSCSGGYFLDHGKKIKTEKPNAKWGSTAYNKQNTDAPFVDMAQLKLWKEVVMEVKI